MATPPTTPFPRLVAPAAAAPTARPPFASALRAAPTSLSYSLRIRRDRRLAAAMSKDTASGQGQEQEQDPAPSAAGGGVGEGKEAEADAEGASPGEKSPEEVAAELKEVLRARKEAEGGGGGGWLAGAAQEMAEIEWPPPGKVVGTTGVVLGVIAGSTAALLSVNALLAELSDRVFAGRGLQDFFSG